MMSGLNRYEVTDPANHKHFQPPEIFAPVIAETRLPTTCNRIMIPKPRVTYLPEIRTAGQLRALCSSVDVCRLGCGTV